MSGHSKWSTIKRQKQANDIKKGKLYGAAIKTIESAIALGGVDVDSNSALKDAIENAKRKSIPKTIINRAIERALERKKLGKELRALMYEIITPKPYSGAIILEAATDNPNGFFAQLRKFLNKRNYFLSEKEGAIKWMFKHQGVVEIEKTMCSDELMDEILNYTEDILDGEKTYVLFIKSDEYHKFLDFLSERQVDMSKIENDLAYIPTDTIESDDEYIDNVKRTVEELLDMDEVIRVSTNFKKLNNYID